MSRTFTAIAGLAALIALSASAATADENPYSANSMLPACKAVLAISSGNAAAGIDPVEMGRCIGMIEGVALLGRVLINRDCSAIVGRSNRRVLLWEVQAIFFRRRHQARRPPLAKIRPGRPAPAIGPGTGIDALSTFRTSKAQ
jgi:hypothetical protein